MGYTHYWDQKRNFTREEWETVAADLRAIITYAQHECGIALGDGGGEPGTSPQISDDVVIFNGIGDDSHETLIINRVIPKAKYKGDTNPSWDFCKTARKPYDAVVTACLCYLSTATRTEDPTTHAPIIGSEVFTVSSDGDGKDFLVGLDLARKALAPRLGNELDIPMDVMKADRWCAPYISVNGGGGGCTKNKNFEVHFCIDGRGYVLKPRTGESYCFESHHALAVFLDQTKSAKFAKGGSTGWGGYGREEPNIWSATGSFDTARHDRIRKAQEKVLRTLFPVDPACTQQPPLYVRPGEMPDNAGRDFCYSIGDLLNLANGKAA